MQSKQGVRVAAEMLRDSGWVCWQLMKLHALMQECQNIQVAVKTGTTAQYLCCCFV
jgi:hypothetical protein